jgi:hypothetical protein
MLQFLTESLLTDMLGRFTQGARKVLGEVYVPSYALASEFRKQSIVLRTFSGEL